MKKLTKLQIKNFRVMDDVEMKNLTGGEGGSPVCLVTCKSGKKTYISKCERSLAEGACGGADMAEQCSGPKSVCDV